MGGNRLVARFRGLSASQLKWIAMGTMVMDHIGAVFGIYLYRGTVLEPLMYTAYSSCLRWLGRLSFPIFAFLLARGCDKTRSLARYAGRLAVFAVVSQIPYTLALHGLNFARIGAPEQLSLVFWDMGKLNIMFTLMLGLTVIALWKQGEKCWLWRAGAVIPIILAEVLNCSYGSLGVLLIFCLWKLPSALGTGAAVLSFSFLYYLVQWNQLPGLSLYSFKIGTGFKQMLPWLTHPIVGMIVPFVMANLSLMFVLRYNGERGNLGKWTPYAFYPVHLLILAFLREVCICFNVFA